MRGQVKAQKLVSRARAHGFHCKRNERMIEEVRERIAIALGLRCKNRDELKALTVPALKLRPDCAHHSLDAGLGVVTDDRRDIDQQPRLIAARAFAKLLAMTPQPREASADPSGKVQPVHATAAIDSW
jgi:hypothetical protein